MELTDGKISPTGGRTGHGHTPEAIGAQEKPTTAERAAIEAASDLAALKVAMLAWFDSQ